MDKYTKYIILLVILIISLDTLFFITHYDNEKETKINRLRKV